MSTQLSPENQLAQFNARLYALTQAFGGAIATIVISLGGLTGAALLGTDKSLATAPVTAFNIGVALGAVPAAIACRMWGRKLGFMSGGVVSIIGFLLAGFAIILENFWFFGLATLVIGISGGFHQQYRFAAADHGTPDYKPKAISTVLIGGIAAAVIGPQLVIYTADLLPDYPNAGAFLAAPILGIVAILVLTQLRTAPIVADEDKPAPQAVRSLDEIARQPRFIVSVLCATSGFALMSFVMTGAPLAMLHHGHHQHDAVLGIQWHVLAMFAPSLITGQLMARFGKETVVATGMILLIASAVLALAGLELWNFWTSLIFLGLGWNFSFLGATAMLTDTHRPEEKSKVQGFNDLIVFGTVALSSLASGLVLNLFGWFTLNIIVFPIVGAALLSLGWLMLLGRNPLGKDG